MKTFTSLVLLTFLPITFCLLTYRLDEPLDTDFDGLLLILHRQTKNCYVYNRYTQEYVGIKRLKRKTFYTAEGFDDGRFEGQFPQKYENFYEFFVDGVQRRFEINICGPITSPTSTCQEGSYVCETSLETNEQGVYNLKDTIIPRYDYRVVTVHPTNGDNDLPSKKRFAFAYFSGPGDQNSVVVSLLCNKRELPKGKPMMQFSHELEFENGTKSYYFHLYSREICRAWIGNMETTPLGTFNKKQTGLELWSKYWGTEIPYMENY